MLYKVIDQKPDRMEKVMDQYNDNCGLCVETVISPACVSKYTSSEKQVYSS